MGASMGIAMSGSVVVRAGLAVVTAVVLTVTMVAPVSAAVAAPVPPRVFVPAPESSPAEQCVGTIPEGEFAPELSSVRSVRQLRHHRFV
jgi:hypothetical protein